MKERIDQELVLLRTHYGDVQYVCDGHWFLLQTYRVPPPWQPGVIPVVFCVTIGYPGAPPYGFFVPAELRFNGVPPTSNPPKNTPPFPGQWLHLSWQPDDWRPTADVRTGSNLWGWCRGFAERLRQGP